MKYWALEVHTNPFVMEKQTVVDLIERSSTTPDSVCNRLKFEGTKLETNGAMESANEEYPVVKRGVLFKLLQDLELE